MMAACAGLWQCRGMKRFSIPALMAGLWALAWSPACTAQPPAGERPILYRAQAVGRFPHSTEAFTQGLFFADGVLYETTGKVGASRIRRLNLKTGQAVAETALPRDVFGEGSTAVGDRILTLTWRSGMGFVHDRETLKLEARFALEGEGWGLAYDPESDRLILSDGSAHLRFLDPESFEEKGRVEVTFRGQPLIHLNELEWIDGEVWANVWQQDAIARIDPESGAVTGVVDVSGLFPQGERVNPVDDVPNGIAYEARTGRLFVTGKNWPFLYEIEVAPAGAGRAAGRSEGR